MPIEINISTESGRVSARAHGSDEKKCQGLMAGLNLSKSQIESAMGRIHSGYRGPLMTFGYNLIITPESDRIEISEQSKLLAVASDTLRNRASVAGTYTTTLRDDVTHTVNVKWSSTEQLTRGFEIGGELYIKGSGHMSFTTTTGSETSKQKSEVIGSTRGVSVTLKPGQAAKANLMVKRRTVKVRVPFRVVIDGHVAGGYGPIEEQPRTIYLDKLLKKIGRPTSYETEAVFEIVCFTDADVQLEDL